MKPIHPAWTEQCLLQYAKSLGPSSMVFLVSPRGPEPCIPGLPSNSFY